MKLARLDKNPVPAWAPRAFALIAEMEADRAETDRFLFRAARGGSPDGDCAGGTVGLPAAGGGGFPPEPSGGGTCGAYLRLAEVGADERAGDSEGDGAEIKQHRDVLQPGRNLLAPTDYSTFEGIREQFRLFAAFEDQSHIDAILELLNDDAGAHDPDWTRPNVMGKAPRDVVVKILTTPTPRDE